MDELLNRALQLIVLLMALLVPSAAGQGVPKDEVSGFFRRTRIAPTAEEKKSMEAAWRKSLIGSRHERLEARTRIVEFAAVAVDFLAEKLRQGKASETRSAALGLSRLDDPVVLETLRSLLFAADRAEDTGRELALAMGLLGEPRDAPRLLAVFKKTKRRRLQRALVYAMGSLEQVDIVEGLVARWHREKNSHLRRAILLALGRIGGPEARELIRKATKSPKEGLRRAAALAAADLRDVTMIADLRRLVRDSDDAVAGYALIGLSLLRDDAVAVAIRKTGVLKHADSRRRALAVTVLGTQVDDASLRMLKNRLKSKLEKSEAVLRAMAFAVARRPAAVPKGFRERLLRNRNSGVLRAAWCATAIQGQKSAGGHLARLIRDPKLAEDVRLTLMELLSYSSAAEARKLFAKLAQEKRFTAAEQKLSDILTAILAGSEETRRDRLRGRVQVEVDGLEGSPEWNLLQGLHLEFLAIEDLDRPLSNSGGSRPGAQPGARRPDTWTNDAEDLRLWFDRYPYFDRRNRYDVDL